MEKPVKVLAVDDDEYILKIQRACLPPPAFDLVACRDAMSAMAAFKGGGFDIVLLDVVMPGIDGFELLSLIRNSDPEIPVIMLTAKVDDINGTMLKKISGDRNTYYQGKSFSRGELVSKINSIVSQRISEEEKKRYFAEMEKDAALAGEVQRLMFPNWDTISGGARFCFCYRPYMKITGDIFSFTEISDGVFLSIMGDISGHGIQSALCMSAVEYSLAKYIRLTPSGSITPHGALNHLQTFMSGLGADRYMTCLVAVTDFRKRSISFQSAGHPDFIMYTPAGGASTMNPRGLGALPVGLVRGTVYGPQDTVCAEFPEDAVLFSYTDGLEELQDRPGGGAAMAEFIESFAGGGASPASVFRIADAMFKLGSDRIADDISLAAFSAYSPKPDSFDFSISPMFPDIDAFAQKAGALALEKTGNGRFAAKAEILSSEFLNNVVVHGLGGRSAPRPIISAHVEFRAEDVRITFHDKGRKWDPETPPGASGAADGALAGSGRGLAMIREIASSIKRCRYADILNETVFTIPYEK